MSRLTTGPDDIQLDADDRAALELLRLGAVRSRTGAPDVGAGRTVWDQESSAEALGLLGGVSPISEAALSIWGVASMKGPARGHVPRKAWAWVPVVLGLDLSQPDNYHLLAEHLGLAVAAGISVDAIEALRDGHLSDLADDDRQHVHFIRALTTGTVTDELWKRQVAVIGGDRNLVEQVHLILFLWAYVRVPQAMDSNRGLSERELDDALALLRSGERPPADIAAYERYYVASPWPKPAPAQR